MDEKQLEQHVKTCRSAMQARQAAFEKEYDLAQYPAYWGDGESIVLESRAEPPARYEFNVVFIGRHTADDKLTWGWADESLPPATRERSARIRALAATTGFPQFDTPVIEADPPNLEKILAVVLDHLEAAACFADKSREPMLLVAILGPGVEKTVKSAGPAPAAKETGMSSTSDFMETVLSVLRNSEDQKLEALFHGVNLPPNWFEMVAPEFTGLFGTEITGTLIDIGDIGEDQLATLKNAPQDVQENVKQALKLDYKVPDSAEKESGTLTLPVYCTDEGCKILLVGG